jgi:DNA polymerase V
MLAALPLGCPVPCRGDTPEEQIDLHAALVPNPVCTFYMRVSGHRLREHGIRDGDLVVIDRSVAPHAGAVVVVAHQGVFLMRQLLRQGSQWLLQPLRAGETAIALNLEAEDRSGLFGVVVHVVHHLNKPRRRRAQRLPADA